MECDILTFCASHITCEKRIELLANAIKSIVEQKCKTCNKCSINSFFNCPLDFKMKIYNYGYIYIFKIQFTNIFYLLLLDQEYQVENKMILFFFHNVYKFY